MSATFKLNGQEIPFEPGDTVIRAAWRQGIEIPHYCWHPGLSIAANCRMCLVEVQSGRPIEMPILKWDDKKKDYVPATKPKLQPACQLPAAPGLEISSESANVKQAQASVQEFLLLNHPVDCPICDQAGECKLQDYYYEHQNTAKRKLSEPVHKPKGVRFGPTIVYDAERCIVCTRCVRVCDELVGDHVLDVRERGNKNEIVVSPGRELDHRYTLMTEHVCPVGALTSKDFRFKARVWFLKSAPSICPGCATGCNMHADFDPRYGKLYRLRPRDNLAVNKYWMCDDGMMTYKRVHEGRVSTGIVGRGVDRDVVMPDEALKEAAQLLLRIDPSTLAVVLSADHASEDNHALVRFAKAIGAKKFYLAARGGWEGDNILRDADNNANRRGAEQAAGGKLAGESALLEAATRGEIKAVLALGSISGVTGLDAVRNLPVVVLSSHESPWVDVAEVVVPVACWAEMNGTFVNRTGIAQLFQRVVDAAPGVQATWQTLVALALQVGANLRYGSLKELRSEMTTAAAPVAAPSAEVTV